MQTATITRPRPQPAVIRARPGASATRIVVGVYGALVGLGGIEHGIGEILQGPVQPGGVVIASWPEAAAMRVLSGEPAMTIVPHLLLTGVLAVTVGLAIAVWSVAFAARRHGGAVLIALSALLLLVGGGFGPPLMGLLVGLTATRIGADPRRPPGPVGRTLGPRWPWLLGVAVAAYLSLMPGVVVLHQVSNGVRAGLVGVLSVLVFATLGAALVAARAHDRTSARPALP